MLGRFGIDVYVASASVPAAPGGAARGRTGFPASAYLVDSTALSLALVIVRMAHALPPPAARRALLLAPLVLHLAADARRLQKGNVQLMIVALAMVAMPLFERRRLRRRWRALLAFATVSELFRGLLLRVY